MTKAVSASLLPDNSRVDPVTGALKIADVDLRDIADEFGTPAFVYDEEHLRARCREAVAAFPAGVAYASKAFLCKAMARLAADEGMSIDVASGGELHTCLVAGVAPRHISLHGNNKSLDEIEMAFENEIGLVVVDCFEEIARIEQLFGNRKERRRLPCMVRVSPGIEAHTHDFVMTGADDSKFGFNVANGDAHRAVELMAGSPAVEFRGVHAHIGSNVLATESFSKAVEVIAAFVKESHARELSIGGGLGVAYTSDELAPSIADWGIAVRSGLIASGLPEDFPITAEPGRSIVATAGITLYRVGIIKEIPGIRTYLGVDGGLSENPRPALYDSTYEAFLVRSPGAKRSRELSIAGKHCENDILISQAYLPADVAVGDIMATPVTGAYGYSMASNYNRFRRPPVVFVKDGRARLVLRRETYSDLLDLEVD